MTALDAPEVWPQIGRGGHLRNAKGKALVVPERGGAPRIYRGGSDLDVFDVYDGPAIYGDQGSHVHTITEYADAGKPLDEEMIAAGEDLNISAERQRHCYDTYLEFIARLGWTTRLTECVVVNDEHKVASNIDKVMETDDARWVVVDVKSGSKYERRATAMQLATYVGSRLYDPQSGKRKPWQRDLVQHAAFVFWYPVRADDPQWERIVVRTDIGVELLRRFSDLAADDSHTNAFLVVPPGEQVAAPTTSPVVEPLDGGDATHGSRASLPSTLEGLRALVGEWEPIDRQQLGELMARESVDRTDPAQVAAAIERYTFADIETTPEPRPTPDTVPLHERSVMPDEGPEFPAADFTALSNIYREYPKPARDWIAALAKDAQHGGVGFHTKNNRTARRFHLMRALINICEHDNRDQLLTVELTSIHGDIMVESNPAGLLVGLCDHHQAKTLADRLTEIAVAS